MQRIDASCKKQNLQLDHGHVRGFELEAHWGIKNSFTNRETARGTLPAQNAGR